MSAKGNYDFEKHQVSDDLTIYVYRKDGQIYAMSAIGPNNKVLYTSRNTGA